MPRKKKRQGRPHESVVRLKAVRRGKRLLQKIQAGHLSVDDIIEKEDVPDELFRVLGSSVAMPLQ